MAINMKKFTPWNPHNEHRAYYMAHNVIYDMANDYFTEKEKVPLRIKGRDAVTADRYAASGRSPWFDNPQYYFPKWTLRGATDVLDQKCENWFFKNCHKAIEGMFHANGWKNIEEAIAGTWDYKDLCSIWDKWFEDRREEFMKKQNEEIMKMSGVPAKITGSHGGVANLLKILTKTMMQRGASLDSIAKVQYSVCQQANIYIPSEFLTDVSVLIDYNEQAEKAEREV